MTILQDIINRKARGTKSLAVLLDPDKVASGTVDQLAQLTTPSGIDFIFVGGSLLMEDHFEEVVKEIKAKITLPVVLFPGSPSQLSNSADAVLFLSLISGRNPDLLIGQHVIAAARLRRMNLEVIPTGYMLVDCGRPTTATYISHTLPLPWDKPGIAAMTALAGSYLGLQIMYLDGGSGAQRPVSAEMIAGVRETVTCPLIVGGGIRTTEAAREAWKSGADVVVIGTAWESNPEMLIEVKETSLMN